MQVNVQGNFVPVALVQLNPGEEIFCEGGLMVYADPSIQMSIRPFTQGGMGQTLRRTLVGGVPFWMHVFHGPGYVAFSRFGPGEIRVQELAPGQVVDIAEHSLLLASNTVRYDTYYVAGTGRIGRMVGFWMDRLTGPGTIVYHGHGDILGFDLKPGESMQIDHGGLLRKDATVQIRAFNQPLGQGLMGHAMSFEALQVDGPGRLELQTVDPTHRGAGGG
ncbi:MAG: AIM24 family protein [Euryarchaeota archaeon]|nr:AIM24 family protein [Euryarchaeota archaeon]MDE1835571.1 AIM24 family protein [Euryarchaeota archaeon]MDE1878919.1 AIM24 family protein [Euryarchaeota archaeon]MDE2043807.1 AIM24 family protein [Thermoplasmata archaeon]